MSHELHVAPPFTVKALGRLAAVGATLVCDAPSDALLRDLAANGFALDAAPPQAAIHAHYAPRFTPRGPPSRAVSAVSQSRHAVIVGGGARLLDNFCSVLQREFGFVWLCRFKR